MCEAVTDFHVPNEDEDDHGQSTMAMEAMLEDRDETYKNFIELEYGYTLTEKKARNGYMVPVSYTHLTMPTSELV